MRSGHLQVVTDRLELRPVTIEDVGALFAITSDPATWQHAPESRHRDRDTTEDWIGRAVARWRRDGLSYWLVRLRADQQVVGIGGVQRQRTGNWNLYYRFTPSAWGHGYATELGRAALAAAHDVDNSVAVIAWVLPHNTASINVARRLALIDHGPHADPNDGQLRLAFADRPTAGLDRPRPTPRRSALAIPFGLPIVTRDDAIASALSDRTPPTRATSNSPPESTPSTSPWKPNAQPTGSSSSSGAERQGRRAAADGASANNRQREADAS